jgi:hypothetical protein
LSFNRTQYGVVIGLFIGHKNMRRYFYLMDWPIPPYVGGVEKRKKPQPTFCVNVKLWLHSDLHIWATFLGPKGVKII